jgi:hypothetical protein
MRAIRLPKLTGSRAKVAMQILGDPVYGHDFAVRGGHRLGLRVRFRLSVPLFIRYCLHRLIRRIKAATPRLPVHDRPGGLEPIELLPPGA